MFNTLNALESLIGSQNLLDRQDDEERKSWVENIKKET